MFAGKPEISYTFPAFYPADAETLHRNVEFLIVLGVLFLLDIITTQVILQMGGLELNPMMAGIVANPALHLGIKALSLLAIFVITLAAEQRVRGSGTVFYGILILLYLIVVLNNLIVILPQISL